MSRNADSGVDQTFGFRSRLSFAKDVQAKYRVMLKFTTCNQKAVSLNLAQAGLDTHGK